VWRGKAGRHRPQRTSRPGREEESMGCQPWRRSSQYLRHSFKSFIYRSSWTRAAFLIHHLRPPLEIISLMHSVSQTTHFRFGSPSASSLPLPHRSRVRSPPRRPARKCLLLPSALDTSSLILLHVSSSLLLRPCSRGSTSPLPVRLQDSTLCHAAVEPKRRTALHREGG
jgi:hypothetical protein